MVQAVVMVLALVAVTAVQAALTFWCMNGVSRHQRAKDDLRTCEEIWALTPDY